MSEPQRRQSRIPIPPYTPPESPKPPLPVSLAHRMASRSRSHSRPPTEFVKQGKNLVLRLAGVQVPGTELPVYGLGAAVEGTLELTKPEGITSIEVKVEGTLQLQEIAEGGTDIIQLCLESAVLWSKHIEGPICPSSLSFALKLPKSYSDRKKTFSLPPTYSEHLAGVPGFTAKINYIIHIIVNNQKPTSSLVKSAFLGSSTQSLSIPFMYSPRTRPATAIPPPLMQASTNLGLKQSPQWRMFEHRMASRMPGGQDVTSRFYIPASRIFCLKQSIPFHLTFSSSAFALASLLPFLPIASLISPKNQHTKIELLRQSVVDVRSKAHAEVKTDMWRVDCIGRGTFKRAGDGPDWISFVGEISVNDNITLGGFKASGLTVKDCIVLSMTPPDPVKCPVRELRQVVPVLLTTDTHESSVLDEASVHSVPSTPSENDQRSEVGHGAT
ncbi:hypothetical protein FIBSPDRAFT_964594 [Athelia psychrophila]|uniref:Arrestin-like N-terminal domain-containing protein n=1 Tax=Athelia psychrophila TaxID=1759441 RepID=A0A165XMC3_9AGAM|nr:hypothetical protein FIBSPDRAFT_761009 [Fibularhizoctonia sp. CBS 109695]KZP08694.1 hypothetical protein FIBSPDRAFT_964594 [Fibularhizoctonia sp. CBS 109695]